MLIDFSLLLGAMLAMMTAAVMIDFVRDRVHGKEGSASPRMSDSLLVNLLFFTLLPGTIYGWLFPLVPFSGLRAGLFLALLLFVLAVAPTLAAYRIKAPGGAEVTTGHLFWLFVKYLAVYGLLAYIYRP
jgi:hypothetical protein